MPALHASTLEHLPDDHAHSFHHPFLVVTWAARDIGLVGWNEHRWTHQNQPSKRQRKRSQRALQARTQGQQDGHWKLAFDATAMMYYYYNEALGLTQWEAPDAAAEHDETVKFYVGAGIAPDPPAPVGPWDAVPAAQHLEGEDAEIQDLLEGCSLQGEECSDDWCPTAALVPATERFAPARKGELPPPVERYWVARYSLFSRWSQGVCLNEKSLFSVTPEILAQHHAHMFQGAGVVLDAFCGCGGNAIQLALAGNQVRPSSLEKDCG